MKLAFCLFKYFPYGGLQRDFVRIARACQQRGHEIHVYTQSWEGEREPDFQLHLLPTQGWQNHTRQRHFVHALQRELQQHHYDLVIGFNKMPGLDIYYAADVCYVARIKAQRSWWARLTPRYRQYAAYEKAVFMRGQSTQILLISPAQQLAFTQQYFTEPERFTCLPPGIARDRIAPTNAAEIRTNVRQQAQLTENNRVLLMVGSGFKTKGLDRALYGLAALPATLKQQCQLWVVGQDDPAIFIALAKKLAIHDQVKFLGGRSDIPALMLAADLLLHPAYHENTGTVLLEAVVAGLPVLTVAACGYAHYIESAQAGCVLPAPFSQTQFNLTLQEMLLSPQQPQWRTNALAFAKTADIYSLPEKAADIIDSGSAALDPGYHPRIKNFRFADYMMLKGECFRHQKSRLTQRIQWQDKTYFIKQHTGIGWKEIVKNLLHLRWPIISAKNEWQALTLLRSLNVSVPAVIAAEERGWNPARKQSFVLMEALAPVISLEHYCGKWLNNPPTFQHKKQLLAEVARIARVLHENGINHRDFYLCHFLLHTDILPQTLRLSLIDLHRAQIRSATPTRWVIKDLAGLYFSSKEIGLTKRDGYRFMKWYHQCSLREILQHKELFWQKVKNRGEQLYLEHC